jgi:hypothetical protein
MSLKKKLKKAAKFAGAAYLASKALSGSTAGINVDKGRGSALSQRYRKPYKDPIMSGGKGATKSSISMMDKIKNATSDAMKKTSAAVNVYKKKGLNTGPGPKIKKTDSLADKVLSGNVFGLGDMDGAKAGGMMYANTGKYVKAKCKLGKNKKTLIT